METEFDFFWNNSSNLIFRLELLNSYDVDEEREHYEKYLKGILVEDESFKDWLRRIKETRDRGVRIIRIHVVDLPLSQYLRYEIEMGYSFSQKRGEEIFLLDRTKIGKMVDNMKDFWLFDDKNALPIEYDSKGRFLKFDSPITNYKIDPLVRLRKELLSIATPLEIFKKQYSIRSFDHIYN